MSTFRRLQTFDVDLCHSPVVCRSSKQEEISSTSEQKKRILIHISLNLPLIIFILYGRAIGPHLYQAKLISHLHIT